MVENSLEIELYECKLAEYISWLITEVTLDSSVLEIYNFVFMISSKWANLELLSF